ncbi:MULTISPECIES: hypothetical protein [Cysteiniphilum]|uniref:Uncharacterized protein n=1 Tax=Cysteiniphilum litorale TaxID=2056700 RepID=A0A8J2Z3C6_9GAMM|nr:MULTISPECIES: hypothetical protein [Cysteiniphilum]GGF93447.1 hypothetical protein GCM10010995_08250 [Cysteiniphilum litorale]
MGSLKQLIENAKNLTYTVLDHGKSRTLKFGNRNKNKNLFQSINDDMTLENLITLKDKLTAIGRGLLSIVNLDVDGVTKEEKAKIDYCKGELDRQIDILDHFESLHKSYTENLTKWDAAADGMTKEFTVCKERYAKYRENYNGLFESLFKDLVTGSLNEGDLRNKYIKKIENLHAKHDQAVHIENNTFMDFLKSIGQKIMNLFKNFCYKLSLLNPSYENRLKGAVDCVLLDKKSVDYVDKGAHEKFNINIVKEAIDTYAKIDEASRTDLGLANAILEAAKKRATTEDKNKLESLDNVDQAKEVDMGSDLKLTDYMSLIKGAEHDIKSSTPSIKKDVSHYAIKNATDKPQPEKSGIQKVIDNKAQEFLTFYIKNKELEKAPEAIVSHS